MANLTKAAFLADLSKRYGELQPLSGSYSLFATRDDSLRVYIRYSRVHNGARTFYGLRQEDLQCLEGHASVICFLWNEQEQPLVLPYADYEEVFRATTPASDGQYKVQVLLQNGNAELYIAQAGRFNVEGNVGWHYLDSFSEESDGLSRPELTHSQTQTLLGAIGALKGYDIWVPTSDRAKLDWSFARAFECRDVLPDGFPRIEFVMQEVDVIWVRRGSSEPRALFEVEHSTPIYSALLRFNDIHLTAPSLCPQFTVVANDSRRSLFVKQLNRPTFRQSGLTELCTFLDYRNAYQWHRRLTSISGGQH